MIEDATWVAGRLAAGATVSQIADAAGVSRQTASTWMRRHGLHANKQPHPRPSPEALAALLAECGTTVALAERLGVSQPTAARWLRESGHEPLARVKPRKPVTGTEVRRRRAAGETWEQIATALGIAVTTAHERAAEDPTVDAAR